MVAGLASLWLAGGQQVGTVTTVAGTQTVGHSDGLQTSASFYFPNAVGMDAAGGVAIVVRGGRGGGGWIVQTAAMNQW